MICLGILLIVGAQGQTTLYWDTNSTATGAGTTPTGTWNTGNSAGARKWSTNAAGTSASIGWQSGANAVSVNAFTVTVGGTWDVSSITVQATSPAVTFTAGTLNFSDNTPDLDIGTGTTLNWGSTTLTSSTGNLDLNTAAGSGGTLSLANNLSLAGTLTLGGGMLSLSGSSYTFGTLNVTGDSIIDFGGSTTLNLNNLAISAGVTLTIQNWANAADYFFTQNWTGASFNTTGANPMNQVVFTGFDSNDTKWQSYDSQITPVPEPSTYGAMLLAATGGLFAWRRRRLSRRDA